LVPAIGLRGRPEAYPTFFRIPPGGRDLRTAHALAAVVAEVAVAGADGDGTAGVATGGVELEAGELAALDGVVAGVHTELGCG
jgi:hypothetical protein